MKKFFFFAVAIAAVSMVSCKDDDSDGGGVTFNDNGDGVCDCVYTLSGYDTESSYTDAALESIGYEGCQDYADDWYTGYGSIVCE